MTTITFRVDNPDGGAFTASAIGHSIHTQADTLWELEENAREAAHLHFGHPVMVWLHPISPEFMVWRMTLSSVCGSNRLPGEHPTWGAFEDFDRQLTYDGSFW